MGQKNATEVGQFIVEPPTLENLGFEWYIDGDENRNATVKVEYRMVRSGGEWKKECLSLGLEGTHWQSRNRLHHPPYVCRKHFRSQSPYRV